MPSVQHRKVVFSMWLVVCGAHCLVCWVWALENRGAGVGIRGEWGRRWVVHGEGEGGVGEGGGEVVRALGRGREVGEVGRVGGCSKRRLHTLMCRCRRALEYEP